MIFLLIIALLLIYFGVLYAVKVPFQGGDIVLLLVLIFFMSSITYATDMENYMLSYRLTFDNSFNPGFKMINSICSRLGLSFFEYYFFVHVLSIVILFLSIRLITANLFRVVALYLIFPFILNIIQIKNFLMMAFVMLAFSVCYRCKNKMLEIVVWCALIIVASSMHIAGIAYLPFIFFVGKRNLLEKLPFIMFALTSVFILINGSALNSILQPIISAVVVDSYRAGIYAERMSHYGGFLHMTVSIVMIYIANKVCQSHLLYRNNCSDIIFFRNGEKFFPDYVCDFMLYSTLFWPLYVASAHFTRLMQNQVTLIYIVICMFFLMYSRFYLIVEKHLLNDYLIKIVLCFTIVFWVYIYQLWYVCWDNIVAIIENLNWFYAFKGVELI